MTPMPFQARCRLLWFLLLLFLIVPFQASYAQNDATNLQIVILLDESSSMYDITDQGDLRGEAVRRFIDLLWAEQASTVDHHVAIFLYGQQGDGESGFITGDPNGNPFVRINDDATHDHVIQMLTPRTRETQRHERIWTDTVWAFQEANRVLDTYRLTDHRAAVVVFTDGVPETSQFRRNAPEAVRRPYLQQLTNDASLFLKHTYNGDCSTPRQGAAIIPLVFDAGINAMVSGSLPLWDVIRETTFSPPPVQLIFDTPSEQRRQMLLAFDPVLNELLCRNVQSDSLTLSTEITRRQFRVSNYLEAVTISISTMNPDVTVRVLRPNGDLVVDTDTGNSDGVLVSSQERNIVYSIARGQGASTLPGGWSGDWIVELNGTGEVIISFLPIADVRIQLPSLFVQPLGKPLSVSAQVVSRSPDITQSLPVQGVRFSVRPEQGIAGAPSSAVQQGDSWRGTLPGSSFADEGTYVLLATATIADAADQVEVSNETRFTVLSIPWFDLVQPPVPDRMAQCVNGAYQWVGRIMLGLFPITDLQSADVRASYTPAGGTAVALNVRAAPELGTAVYTGEIPCTSETASSGELRIDLTASTSTVTGAIDTSVYPIIFVAQPTPVPPTPTYTTAPTDTPLPTPTWTPTFTLTPSVTPTPTLTLTPSPTFTPTLPPPPLQPPCENPDENGNCPIPPVVCLGGVLLALFILLIVGWVFYSRLPTLNHQLTSPDDNVRGLRGRFAKTIKVYDADSSATLRLSPAAMETIIHVVKLDGSVDYITIDGEDLTAGTQKRIPRGQAAEIVIGSSAYELQDFRGEISPPAET